jgi:GT2 family glycosyltransferase
VTVEDQEPTPAAALPSEAPPVVAVVVTHDAGPWFEAALASLGAQDYPNLSVLVVDTASRVDPTDRVAAVLPDAVVHHLGRNPGFGPAANHALVAVEGAAFFALCHDDARLDPSAIRLLVEEAFRSNAGIVGPKLVHWGEPQRLLAVGLSADKTGVPASLVERGELDQEQHDAVRDVFAIPGACTLVRADLFEALEGYDPAITLLGEDLDLCWRAQVAGARVMVVPEARVEHREALDERHAEDDRRQLLARHRLRSTLVNYGIFHLVRVLPQAAVLAVVEAAVALARGETGQARDVLGAWPWNLRRLGDVWRRRRLVRATRTLPDSEVRRLQARGSARLSAFLRGELGRAGRALSLGDVGRGITGLTRGSGRVVLTAWLVALGIFLIGSRDLLFGETPAVVGLVPFPDGPTALFGRWTSGFWPPGLGAGGPAPTALALLGAAGTLLLGAMGLLRQLLILGMIPLGLVGMWRLTRPFSARARAVGVIAYAIAPLAYDALQRGSWATLLLTGASPWLLGVLARGGGGEPYRDPVSVRPWWRAALALGLLTALVAAFVPLAVPLVVVVGAALALGSVLAGDRTGGRTLAVTLAAAGLAVVLHLPWSWSLLASGDWTALAGVASLGPDRLGGDELLRFQTLPGDLGGFGWGLLVAASLALLIGGGWRWAWAVRAWTVAVACWGLAAAGAAGLGPDLPEAGVLLAPGAAALALAAALGVSAFELDLRGYRFGWRQLATVVAVAALVVGSAPVLLSALDGRWDSPSVDFDRTLAFMREDPIAAEGSFRVLWLGDPSVLPVAGHELGEAVVFGVAEDGPVTVESRWGGPDTEGTDLVRHALELAATGSTARLGRLLAPLGIRYLAITDRAAPARTGAPQVPLPPGVQTTVDQQLDLRAVPLSDPAVSLYENSAWAPIRSVLTNDDAAAVGDAGALLPAAARVDLAGSLPVLDEARGARRWDGDVPAGTIWVAEQSSARWSLHVGGQKAARGEGFGWGSTFDVDEAGPATLRYDTPLLHWAALAAQTAAWAAVAVVLVRTRRRRRAL